MEFPTELGAGPEQILLPKDDNVRVVIALRVGERLSTRDLSEAEMRGAEILARELAGDAVEHVRIELSKAVMHSKLLPRDTAMVIAHDVQAVAHPFLEVTDVFSDADWQQLVTALSIAARTVMASRTSISEGLALSLAGFADSTVVEILVENPACPMTDPVCHSIIDRFESEIRILDKLALREDLLVEIAVELIAKVSGAVRKSLSRTYDISISHDPPVEQAENGVLLQFLLQLIRETAEPGLAALVASLKEEKKLTHHLVLAALREGLVEFFETALSVMAAMPVENVRTITLHQSERSNFQLFYRAQIPRTAHDDFWKGVTKVRHPNAPD